MRLAALAASLVALAVAAQAGAAARSQEPALSLSVRAEPQPLRACGWVAWTLTLRNRSSQAVTLVFPSGQRGDVVLRRRGAVAYRWSADKAFTLAIEELTVPAGGVRRFVLHERRLRVAPGRYALEARITGTPPGAAKGPLVRGAVVVRRGASRCPGVAPPAPPPPVP